MGEGGREMGGEDSFERTTDRYVRDGNFCLTVMVRYAP
jgi:hypothetical protein